MLNVAIQTTWGPQAVHEGSHLGIHFVEHASCVLQRYFQLLCTHCH